MAHFELALLGPLQVTRDSKQVTGLTSNKARALLAYLVVETSRPHYREALAELLWPDLPERDARRRLRYALSDLRQALDEEGADPSFFLTNRDSLQFNPDADHSLDVAAFEQHLIQARLCTARAVPDTVSAIRHLESAVGLCRGDFLDGLFLDSPGYEQWMVQHRERLHWERMSALSQLTDLHQEEGEYEAAQHYARMQLGLEAWREGAHQQLMRALAMGGQRSAALAQYQICVRQLAEEFGAAPGTGTTALYEAIRSGLGPSTSAEREGQVRHFSVPVFLVTCPARFVARETELVRLEGFLKEALAGRGQVAFLVGEAGSGKTMLMAEFARQAMERHDQVIAADGTCSSYLGLGCPFLPFREILTLLTGSAQITEATDGLPQYYVERLRGLQPVAIREVRASGPDLFGRLVPKVKPETERGIAPSLQEVLLPHRLPGEGYPPSVSQSELFEQITAVLQALSKQKALILCLDDLHWADDSTLSLLFHLGHRLKGSRILVVGAFRPSIVALGRPSAGMESGRHPLEELVNEFGARFGDIVIDLKKGEDRRFVDAYLDAELNRLGAPFRETLFEHTRGNPLFTIELLRSMKERGDLLRNKAGEWVEGSSLDWDHLPPRVEAVVAERMGRLPPALRSTLEVASIEGDHFSAEIIARVRGLGEQEVIQQLSGPLSQQYRLVCADGIQSLEPGGQRLSRYRFCHRFFRMYLYNQLDQVYRAHLHEATGHALEDLYGDRFSEVSEELARHFRAARLAVKAAGHLLEASRHAARLSAHAEAVTLCENGLGLVNSLPNSAEHDCLRVELESARQRSLAELQAQKARSPGQERAL